MLKGRGDFLKRASNQAIKNLSKNINGYLLMVEGSQIDWGGHENDYQYMKTELWDFNETINTILDMAAKDKDMLVIVTADHETGGLTLNESDDKLSFTPKFTTGDHTGVMVPVFAYGAGAQEFAGVYENTEIFNIIVKLLNLK
jgi:alkaline phosphatase